MVTDTIRRPSRARTQEHGGLVTSRPARAFVVDRSNIVLVGHSSRHALAPGRSCESATATKLAAITWRDVVAAWMLAMVLTGTLILTVPKPDNQGSSAHLRLIAPAAVHTHQKVPDAEGSEGDEYCSERDYVNERC